MGEIGRGVVAMVGACVVWGLSPLYYKLLAHVPPPEVFSHRTLWSALMFIVYLALQGRLGELARAYSAPRQTGLILLAALMISLNWLIFIFSVQAGHVTEASLGYYIFPLMAVLAGRFMFGERLARGQWLAIALAALAVLVLTLGLGVMPWVALILSTSFALYGSIKKGLALGPVISVTAEILILMPLFLSVLAWAHLHGEGAFGLDLETSLLLIGSGPLTATPLILFSYAARRVPLSTVGVLQYINPTLQFLCAVAVFGEAFTAWHAVAFALIWLAVGVFSVSMMRQDRVVRRAAMAAAGVSAQVRNPASEASAKP
ncbi:EamA family transporter RarD [Ruegeria marina]|uniref:Chloramphenicol-sensitive protein RarD n=1 Tax=Ruegeria marina TaxID=639004 RepID=A0A1G6QLU7_9RHOB|nr:EamA family transporter RarD [Ruegeria marina]SDC93288.1 chloramphenicol-sensitive protein RarD [Ruegeria marina]